MLYVILFVSYAALAYFYLQAKQDIEDLTEKQDELEDNVLHIARSLMEIENFFKGVSEDENDS